VTTGPDDIGAAAEPARARGVAERDASLDRELIAALRGGGRRVTLPRVLVHRHVRRHDEHVTAEQVHAELAPSLPSLSPATVYATLDLLDELGFIRRLSTRGAATVYDPRTDAHHHAICRRCGRIEDVYAPVDTDGATQAAAAAGFAVERGDVQLTGLCARCAPER
jgi:Fe2+ or Zn2+ uptake regulation protein